jgi:hypothetical protein
MRSSWCVVTGCKWKKYSIRKVLNIGNNIRLLTPSELKKNLSICNRGKFTAGVIYIGGKFATGVVDAVDRLQHYASFYRRPGRQFRFTKG